MNAPMNLIRGDKSAFRKINVEQFKRIQSCSTLQHKSRNYCNLTFIQIKGC